MRKTIAFKLIVLSSVFFLTAVSVYGLNKPMATVKKPPISSSLQEIDGYTTLQQLAMDDGAVRMLKLDDYAYLNYRGRSRKINLYIGYYYTADKAYAAHSPLVCYPSQGWKIDTRPKRSVLSVGSHKVHYEEIVTSFGGEKELVLYWYQARLFTNNQVYQNKIDMGYNKLFENDEQHGFVRVSVPLHDATYDEVKKTATDFIQAFYPKFVDYIQGENPSVVEQAG